MKNEEVTLEPKLKKVKIENDLEENVLESKEKCKILTIEEKQIAAGIKFQKTTEDDIESEFSDNELENHMKLGKEKKKTSKQTDEEKVVSDDKFEEKDMKPLKPKKRKNKKN